MECHSCGRAVLPDDRFCNGCGAPQAADHARTERLPRAGAGDPDATELLDATPTPAAPTAGEPTRRVPRGAAFDPDATELIARPGDDTGTWRQADPEWGRAERTTVLASAPATAVIERTPAPVAAPARSGFRPGAITTFGIVTAGITVAMLVTRLLTIQGDTVLPIGPDAPAAFRTGTWFVDDFADNLSIAALFAIVAILVGAVASAYGVRWGSGLAGGGGLAVAGLAALVVGLAQVPIDAAYEFARIPTTESFMLSITRETGYWLVVAAGALGIVLFFAAINEAFGDRRGGLNPWIAAFGALAALVAATGPLLPERLAVFSDNWYTDPGVGGLPPLLLLGRLIQLGLFGVAGVVGFLSVRRWGLGLMIGGCLPAVWLTVSVLGTITDQPAGLGWRNPGADGMHIHAVTAIGMAFLVIFATIALIAAHHDHSES